MAIWLCFRINRHLYELCSAVRSNGSLIHCSTGDMVWDTDIGCTVCHRHILWCNCRVNMRTYTLTFMCLKSHFILLSFVPFCCSFVVGWTDFHSSFIHILN